VTIRQIVTKAMANAALCGCEYFKIAFLSFFDIEWGFVLEDNGFVDCNFNKNRVKTFLKTNLII